MNTTLTTLQLITAGQMAESVSLYSRYGILDEITKQKFHDDILAAPPRIEQFRLTTPESVFMHHRKLFGFSDWTITRYASIQHASNTSCKLCAIAQTMGTVQPCRLCCINPLTALCGALKIPYSLEAETTLWDSGKCNFLLQSKHSINEGSQP